MGGYKCRKTGKRGEPFPREKHRIFLLVCDDKKTSPIYFRNYNDRKSPLKIETPPSGGKDPLSLTKYAKDLLKGDYSYLDLENGDAVWCVFDRDDTPNDAIIKAFESAKKNNIRICLSNPCFELWYLLHFGDYNVTLGDCGNVIRKLKEYIPSYVKNENYYTTLKSRTINAVKHAKRLCCCHEECGIALISRDSDPSTQVYEILEEISRYTGCLKE